MSDHRTIGPNERDPELRAFWHRREMLRVRLEQMRADAEYWNRLHPDEPPIVVDLDLTADTAARRANDYPPGA